MDNVPLYLFNKGENARAYEYLGAHFNDDGSVVFRVWAPHATAVSVVSEFNGWQPGVNAMYRIDGGEVWETTVPDLHVFDTYKFCINTYDGRQLMKCDPYAFHAETRPANASKLYDINGYEWKDAEWLEKRRNTSVYKSPVNIYEDLEL